MITCIISDFFGCQPMEKLAPGSKDLKCDVEKLLKVILYRDLF